MTVCRLVVNTLLGVGMQVAAEAVALGSIPNLPFCGTPICTDGFRVLSGRGEELIDLAPVNLSINESQIGQLD
jgi:hypothetical protein